MLNLLLKHFKVHAVPRTARAAQAGFCYHILNRGNGRAKVFQKDQDYDSFCELLTLATERVPIRLIAYCLMPNHFHLVVWPRADDHLGRWMHWLMTSHVRRYLTHYQTSGHVWQGRYKAFPIQADEHLVSVLRYVERNPLRANLVRNAEDWRWSSLAKNPDGPALDPGPVPRSRRWREFVNKPISEGEARSLQLSIQRDRPFGSESWVNSTATRLGLQHTLRNPGRPRKQPAGPEAHN